MAVFVMTRHLNRTPSYRVRFYTLATPAADNWAKVRIVQYHEKGKKVEDDAYFVDEIDDDELPPGIRKFLFACMTRQPTADRPGFYEVTTDGRTPVRCSCKAAVCRRQVDVTGERDHPCKHRDVVEDILEAGVEPGRPLAAFAKMGDVY